MACIQARQARFLVSTVAGIESFAMAGKAPPAGPRALSNSRNGDPPKRHPPQSDLSSSSVSSPSSYSQTFLNNRIGAPPPTVPRSLLDPTRKVGPQSLPLSMVIPTPHESVEAALLGPVSCSRNCLTKVRTLRLHGASKPLLARSVTLITCPRPKSRNALIKPGPSSSTSLDHAFCTKYQ